MRLIKYFLILLVIASCNSKENIPDVSNIAIKITTQRFENDFFDTTKDNLFSYLQQINTNTPSFTQNYLETILNVDPAWPADTSAKYVNGFIKAYRPVYDSAAIVFKDFSPYEKEIKKGLQFLKHYFPGYSAPSKIITYIGPLDGYGDILTDEAFVIGLHHHLGKNFSLYKSEIVQQTYPEYISKRFEPGYIAINCIKNVVLDMFPEKIEEKSLVEQMVERGKRLFILQKLLPYTEEFKLIGYTKEQMEGCYGNERRIWDLFIQNNLLRTIDNNIIKNYIGEGPKTQELGKDSPGNIGSFAGWQIVKKYMQKNSSVTLLQLATMDPDTIYQQSKYKP
ncbi:MAG: hypothetical protein IPJ81_02085 [Chitinophagaceae bacterium]|nr:hypothetical protein [Chitinophagaceae bacterium]